MKILVVCTGNTCRSPLGELLLRAEVARQGLDGVSIRSAGTSAAPGAPASEGTYLVALEHGEDLSAHRATQLTPALVEQADVVLTMSRGHLQQVRAMGGERKAYLFAEYARAAGTDAEVGDPFGLDISVYRETYGQLERLAKRVVERLMEERAGDQR